MTKECIFSIIIAVYNCAPFLQETLDSLVNQTFGFSKVEVILVDDGSLDSSGEICDRFAEKHPANVVVIHKPNVGVSSARNAGVRVAHGEYINFLDSDDILSPTTLEDVFAFYQAHSEETDIVTIPMEFFDAAQGNHWLNEKFDAGTRLIDLNEESYHCVMSVSASFYPKRIKHALYFNEKQRLAEDAVVNARILCHKPCLGVVNTCCYKYRRRSVGTASAIQSSTRQKWYYLDYMHYFVVEAIKYAQSVCGCIPMHIQFLLACDLHWRIRDPKPMDGVLEAREQDEYIQLLHWAFSHIDDQVLMSVPKLDSMMQYELLYFKHGCAELKAVMDDIQVQVGGQIAGLLSEGPVGLDTVTLRKNILEIDGTIWRYGCEKKDADIWVSVNTKEMQTRIPCMTYDRPDLEKRQYGILLRFATGFRVRIDLSVFSGEYSISLWQCVDGNVAVQKKRLQSGFYSALGTVWPAQYLLKCGRILNIRNGEICVSPATVSSHILHECQLLKTLLYSKKKSDRKAVAARLIYWFSSFFKRKQIWIISDKQGQADDNGEAFFRYMCEKKPEGIDFYFAIDRSAAAFEKLSEIGKVLAVDGYRYKLLYLLSDCIISSQADKESTNPFHDYWHPYQDLLSGAHTVFLQHGVIKDDLSNWLRRSRQNLSGFVTSTEAEYNSILNGNYGYAAEEVWLTGLPRFDRLYDAGKRSITIMPTWRRYLVDVDREHGGWKAKEDLRESQYYKFYASLLNHPYLLQMAEQYGYKIHFRPHPNIIRYAQEFITDNRVVLDKVSMSYRDIYASSNLVVTDYSSAVMDFAYLRKPVIYCHFDAEEFFGGKHMYVRGYYDYERDGFGEVQYDLESTVDCIIEYMKNDCKLKNKYANRINDFFAFNDRNNCQRVYERIIEMEKR